MGEDDNTFHSFGTIVLLKLYVFFFFFFFVNCFSILWTEPGPILLICPFCFGIYFYIDFTVWDVETIFISVVF